MANRSHNLWCSAVAFFIWLSYMMLLSSLRSETGARKSFVDRSPRTIFCPHLEDILVKPGPTTRPTMPDSFLSAAQHFLIHYTTSGPDAIPGEDANQNAIPDYIEKIAAAFDESYRVEIEQLHYQQPPSFKNGTVPYDIYVLNLGTASGITVTENVDSNAVAQQHVSSYILFENDFLGPDFHVHGDEAIQITAAHEFFHAVQLGYVFRKSDCFFFELTAVWMADRVFDAINKHFYYLDYFFAAPDIPLNGISFTIPNIFKHIYGSCIFAFYIAENFGVDAIRWIWEQMPDQAALVAVDQLFRNYGSNFETEFVRFAIWNFFTGSRAQPGFSYAESSLYPEIRVAKDTLLEYYHQETGQGYFLTAAYYIFQPIGEGNFRAMLSTEQTKHWRLGIAGYDGQTVQSYSGMANTTIHLENIAPEQKLVIIPCNVDYLKIPSHIYFKETPESYTFHLQREIKSQQKYTKPFMIDKIYPNPFSTEVTFLIHKLDMTPISIRIFNVQGQQVDYQADAALSTKPNQIIWRPPPRSDQLAAGIYFFRLETGSYSETVKLVLYR